jgi:autotransporter-associated beta strand protein
MKPRIFCFSSFIAALAVIAPSVPSVFAATGIWNGTAGGGDGFWNDTANTEWSGVTGNAWDATNGPNNVAQFNSGIGANIGTSGTPVVNGIIWNGVGGGISSGSIRMDGMNPFVSVSSGQNVSFYGNLLGTNGFTKTGLGTMNLDGGGGVKGVTGGITVNQGGLRLTLGASPNVANSSNTLNLSGSQLEVFGNGTQTLSDFTLGNGGSRIVLTPNGALNSTTLSLMNWTRASNSSALIDYNSTGTAKTLTLTGTLPTLTNSLIGGYATVRDSASTYGFATLDGSNNVVRYTGATVVNAALGANTVSNTNYQATAAGTWFNGTGTTQTLNSLEIAVAGTVSGNNAATYVLNSGGLLFSNTSNTTNGGQANMTFTSATSELHIATVQYNSGFAVPSVRGVTDNGGTSVSLIKDGTGGLSMVSGTFTYTGDTIVNDGILYGVSNMPTGTGKGNLIVNSRGTVTIGVSGSGTRTINGLSNTTLAGGTVNNQNFTSTAATSFLDLGNGNATASFSGVISGNFGIIKSGTGTQTLSGVNTYAGSTAVNAGKLTIASTGTINGTSGITIGAGEFNFNSSTALTKTITFSGTGGKLSGNGTINPSLNVTTGNTLAIGNSIGTMSFGSNLAVGGTYLYELMGGSNTADLADVTGTLTLGGILDLVQLGTFTNGDRFTLFAYDGALSGTFTGPGLVSIGDDTQFTDAGGIWQINYNDNSAGLNGGTGLNYVTITAVPEPNVAALLGGLGAVALLRRRRTA